MYYNDFDMKYKCLLLDVDGTLVPVGPHTIPTDRVINAIRMAHDSIQVSIVTGRPPRWLKDIFKSLELKNPCVINGGSQIVNPETGEILWERPLSRSALREILSYAKKDGLSTIVNDNGVEYRDRYDDNFANPLSVQLCAFRSKEESDKYLEILRHNPVISAHKLFSWNKELDYKMDIYITDSKASKEYAVRELAKIMGIECKEFIGVGDSRSDIPLLNACGLKIAMGNADNKLKNEANYVAPSVEDDGVAHIVEKFILPS